MEATTFYHEQPGSYIRKAFRLAVDHDIDQCGNDPYTGTIGQKRNYRIVTQKPMLKSQAYALANEKIDDFDKWGDCGAIPYVNDDGRVDRIESSVNLSGIDAKEKSFETLRDIAKRQALKADKNTIDVEDVTKTVTKSKVETEATKGAAITRYIIVPDNDMIINHRAAWKDGYDRQSEARAEAARLSEHHGGSYDQGR